MSISKKLLAGLDVDADGHIVVTGGPVDPRFSEPLSGLYWQIADDRGQTLRSRSLWDSSLRLPKDERAAGEVHRHEAIGPANGRVLIAERRVRLNIRERETPVTVAVAIDAAHAAAATTASPPDSWRPRPARDRAGGGGPRYRSAGLRPLDVCGAALQYSCRRELRLAAGVPDEVRPLVDEVNALLAARAEEVERSRHRAAISPMASRHRWPRWRQMPSACARRGSRPWPTELTR